MTIVMGTGAGEDGDNELFIRFMIVHALLSYFFFYEKGNEDDDEMTSINEHAKHSLDQSIIYHLDSLSKFLT